jgi:hypothetical protein
MKMNRFTICLAAGLLLAWPLHAKPALAAGGVVGNGTPASCTETAFDTVFFNAQTTGGGVITFNCGASPYAIVLSAYKPVNANTEIHGNNLITLSGGNNTTLFQVSFGKQFKLTNITLTRAYGYLGAIENFGTTRIEGSRLVSNTATGSGGAVVNHGDLVVLNSTIAYNESKDAGGGIYSDGGTVIVRNSQFTGNYTVNEGGGILVRDGSVANIDASQFTQNKATYVFAEGGAIGSRSTFTVTNSIFAQNNSSRGGAVSVIGGTASVSRTLFNGNWGAYGGAIRQSSGLLNVTDSTFAGNGVAPNGAKVTTGGGALSWGDGSANLTNVTMSNNWASYGGGFDHENGTTNLVNVTFSGNGSVSGSAFDTGGGTINLLNATILNNSMMFAAGGILSNRPGAVVNVKNVLLSNPGYKNCYAAIPSATFSFSSDNTCGFGTNRDNVKLPFGPLSNNGGGMLTHMPLPGNPGIDAGSSCPSTDQRGVTRAKGLACDAGAVEYEPGGVTPWQNVPLVLR